MAVYVPI